MDMLVWRLYPGYILELMELINAASLLIDYLGGIPPNLRDDHNLPRVQPLRLKIWSTDDFR